MAVPIGRWFEIRQRLRQVSAEQFIEQGLSGQALGDAIYAERLSVLSAEISAPGTAPGLKAYPVLRRLGHPTRRFSEDRSSVFRSITVFSAAAAWMSRHNAHNPSVSSRSSDSAASESEIVNDQVKI